MRKSRHFIKNLAKKINVYVVVFVALVNACFYCPEVYAADSYPISDSISVVCQGEYLYSSLDVDVVESLSFDYPVSYLSSELYSGSTRYTCSYDFYIPIQIRFLPPADSPTCFVSGVFGLSFYFYLNANISSDEFSDVVLDIYSVDAPSGVTVGGYSSSRYLGSGSNIKGSFMTLDIFFDNVNFSKYSSFNVYVHVVGSSLNYGPATSGLFYLNSFSFDSGSAVVYPGLAPDSQNNYIANGYDDSAGNQLSSDFESGVNDYDQAEDSLFNISTGALQGFEFFDFGSFSAVTSGLSFCSSLLTSIYENFGGLNGIGIVISVLFSVLFMAIVIGFFRYYK